MSDRARRRALAMLLAAPLLLGFTQPSVDEIVHSFDLIVFNSEFREIPDQRVRKWVAPIRIYLDVRVADARHYRALTQGTVDRLVAASGHDIRVVDDRSTANVITTFDRMAGLIEAAEAVFPGDTWFMKIFKGNDCTGRYYVNDRGEIYKAYIFIPTDWASSKGVLSACVVEETAQILGLPNDSDQVEFSIFNDRSRFMDLTEDDLTLIRLLYDSRLKPGMRRREALETVRRIVLETQR